MGDWPESADELVRRQAELGRARPPLWQPSGGEVAVGGCFVCFERGPAGPGRKGEPGWAGAAVCRNGRIADAVCVAGTAGAAYESGLLALREGPLLAAAVAALPRRPDVLLVDATGRDHPRRAGLALHLGALLELPTIGVTHRPLVAQGAWPSDERGATAPLRLDGDVVGYWLRTARGTRPLAVHAAWRTNPETAVAVVGTTLTGFRTPQPLREARRVARAARAEAGVDSPEEVAQ